MCPGLSSLVGKRKGDVISSFADDLERKSEEENGKQSCVCCFGKGFFPFLGQTHKVLPWAP